MRAHERPALLVLDLRMEGSSSGLTVLRAMRENPKTAEIPGILRSAAITFLRERGDDVCTLGCEPREKPFAAEDFIAMIGRLLALRDRA